MPNILKSDLYRFVNSKLLYGLIALTAVIPFLLTMMIRNDIRLGISVYGNLILFREIDDIVRMGIQYQNGLGIFVAVLISVFIGQEYQWKTWQSKWIMSKSRMGMYLSKAIFSALGSAVIFMIYQMVVLFSSGQIGIILAGDYISMLIFGLLIYAALGIAICLIAMSIKNNVAGPIVCLCYVLFSETLLSAISNVGNISVTVRRFVELGIRHSVFGMSAIVSSMDFSPNMALGIVVNALIIIVLSSTFGLVIFRKYEL